VVYLTMIVWQWFHHFTYISWWLDEARIGGCSHLSVLAEEHRGLYTPSGCSQRIGELEIVDTERGVNLYKVQIKKKNSSYTSTRSYIQLYPMRNEQ
jgi:hypothetical protein